MSGTSISEDVVIEGDLSCSGSLQVWGRIDGDVVAGRLEIMVGGLVKGTVEAHELVVRGEHVGAAVCSTVQIAAEANVRSTITSKTLACDPGATISGKLSIIGGDRDPAGEVRGKAVVPA